MYLELLSMTRTMISEHLGRLRTLISDLDNLSSQYSEYKKTSHETPFNIILASSELYYRENYHSDIIAAIIKRGDFYRMFIRWLNLLHKCVEIDYNNYADIKVEREEGRIDILIKSDASKHCIIVENKINNASDMDRQLPRYIETQKKIYLLLMRWFTFLLMAITDRIKNHGVLRTSLHLKS